MPSKPEKSGQRKLEKQIEIAAPVDAVWHALTDLQALTHWFPLQAGTNPDGSIWLAWRDEFRFNERIEIVQPQRHLRWLPLTDHFEGAKGAEGQVEGSGAEGGVEAAMDFFLHSEKGHTRLRLVHSGFAETAEWDELYDGTSRGWDFELFGLKHYLEQHRGHTRTAAYARVMLRNLSRKQAWQRLLQPDMLLQEGKLDKLRPGDNYHFTTAAGDTFTGEVVSNLPPKEFAGTVQNLNNSLMRLQLDDLYGYRDASFILSAYGVERRSIEPLEQRMRALLERLNA